MPLFMAFRPTALACTISLLAAGGKGASTNQMPTQPTHRGSVGQFELVGNSLGSAQQMFLGTPDKVYIIDKTENNPSQFKGHPVWASEWSSSSKQTRPMDVITNSFCAGGSVLGNGTWINVGGNQAVTYGGATAHSQTGGLPYNDPDGGQSIRLLNPCDDGNCDWMLAPPMTTRRWYPSLETLEDGRVIIMGGCNWGGYVNSAGQNNPTYEFFPSRGNPVTSPILQNTLPVNLYPLIWLLPSGKLFVQSGWKTVLLDYVQNRETQLSDMPDAVRVYPASAGSVMLPLTPANNYTATLMFCGGSNITNNGWNQNWDIPHYNASTSCVKITPDLSSSYSKLDPLPEGRTMGNLLLLPNGQILCLNGARTGTAGYGNTSFTIGQSYADQALTSPIIYNPRASPGQQWSRNGIFKSIIPRMYHSSATLLPDGSVLVAGSNPNSDVNLTAPYPTEYRMERFYPSYYNERRPQPQGLPTQLTYGGLFFDVELTSADLFSQVDNIQNANVIVMRTGFSTHTMNMGMRMLQLQNTFTGADDGGGVLHVAQLPPNPATFPPGPALLFVVVNGIPSIGVQVMVGSGQIEQQSVSPSSVLPDSGISMSHGSTSHASGAVSRFFAYSVSDFARSVARVILTSVLLMSV
ncbi:glyoxal oxidase [Coniophora puteana RWD-64-598 SS2]|uniref:Glyoxal oxidase n=1 Tax=Coniophora puteana (strain RWD-64-598) TaxID=741705 RepID=A0A5M3MW61_CONPW|nr:glyoxal oxidase [Coniophora puteana RWD-64-598 SS2]EIW82831.1 glyoxal oxidase [Coniophora puteana RWD-64-598 SS2]